MISLVLLILLFGHPALGQDVSTLQLVQLLWRHGDRTPTKVYDNDPYKPYWTDLGKGELTPLGMEQHYELGQYFRKRYSGYLNATYRARDIYIRSTDVDRALMSASCNLAGMYPPEGDQVWNGNIPWQPMPIHTVPKDTDWLHVDTVCPLYDELVAEALATPEALALLEKYTPMFEYAAKKAGKKIKTFEQAAELYSCLHIEKLKNMTWPDWVTDDVYQQLSEVNLIDWSYAYPDPESRRLRGGPIVGELSSNINNKISGKNDYRLQIYSAHDTTVSALLSVLDVWDGTPPPYTATVITELHLIDKDYFVQISYLTPSNPEPVVLTLPGCEALCPIDTFQYLTAGLIPDDVTAECQTATGSSWSHVEGARTTRHRVEDNHINQF